MSVKKLKWYTRVYEKMREAPMNSFSPDPEAIDYLYALLVGRNIPEQCPKKLFDWDHIYEYKDVCSSYNVWIPPSMEWISELATHLKGKKVLEVFSGCGYITMGLQKCGINAVASDSFAWNDRYNWSPVVPMMKKEAHIAARESDADVLLMSWPPYDEISAAKALVEWGNKPIIYIGEGNGGCTADDLFHHLLDYEEDFYLDTYKGFLSDDVHLVQLAPEWKERLEEIKKYSWGDILTRGLIRNYEKFKKEL